MVYAIVDIETTGGFASGNKITEISILIHDGTSVVNSFETLLNPNQNIPGYIEALTGISNQMVVDSPTFAEVAGDIYQLLENTVFVAHNVNFDFSFIKHELAQCGYDLQCKKLCTVRLARKLLPGYPSYSLGKLCDRLSIKIDNRHRAGGDAAATAILFKMLLDADKEDTILQSLKKGTKEHVLPPNLDKSEIEKLPSEPGVYYFKNQKGKIIYIGKAKSIKKRVSSHFTGNNTSRQRQNFLKDIFTIDFEPCGTELMAFILEATEIKRLWPENNRALKHPQQKYALYAFENQRGYIRLAVDKYKAYCNSLYSFDTLLEGHNLLKMLIKEHLLCEKLCFIQKNRNSCTRHEEGNCAGACLGQESAAAYNVRVKYAMQQLKSMLPSFALLDKGRNEDEQSCLLVEQGKFYGMGYISHHADVTNADHLKSVLTPYPSNDYILHMILSHTTRYPQKKVAI